MSTMLTLYSKVDPKTTGRFEGAPVTAPIGGGFGWRQLLGDLANIGLRIDREDPDGSKWNLHGGIDVLSPELSEVRYPAPDGDVIYQASEGFFGTGGTVVIDTHQGYYLHLYHLRSDRPMAGVGQKLTLGSFIGYSGGGVNSPGRGASTGPHLHVGVLDVGSGQYIDPLGDQVEWLVDEDLVIDTTFVPEPVISEADQIPLPWRFFYESVDALQKQNPPDWNVAMDQLKERLVLLSKLSGSGS